MKGEGSARGISSGARLRQHSRPLCPLRPLHRESGRYRRVLPRMGRLPTS